jgi:peroxiredoxin
MDMTRSLERSLCALLLVCCVLTAPVYAASASPAVGSIAPDFTSRNLVTGEKVRLSSAQGKLVFLTFWATWCAPCRQELPILENVQKKLGQDKVMVYAVSFREPEESQREVKRRARLTGWQITLLEDPGGRIAGQYGISAIPHLFSIGRDGKILTVRTGYGKGSIDELVEDINAALKGADQSPAATQ